MSRARIVFSVFAVLFDLLYTLMILMFWEELQTEEVLLAQALDVGILALGALFMMMQLAMLRMIWSDPIPPVLRSVFYTGLGVWFLLEVVLSYLWCFVTGADPLLEHTPFVVIFLFFNAAQLWALRSLGVLQPTSDA